MGRIPVIRKVVKEQIVLPAPSPSDATVREVRKLLQQYAVEVEHSDLSHSSKSMNIDFADCFVRWMNGGFQPGLRGKRNRGKARSNIV